MQCFLRLGSLREDGEISTLNIHMTVLVFPQSALIQIPINGVRKWNCPVCVFKVVAPRLCNSCPGPKWLFACSQ